MAFLWIRLLWIPLLVLLDNSKPSGKRESLQNHGEVSLLHSLHALWASLWTSLSMNRFCSFCAMLRAQAAAETPFWLPLQTLVHRGLNLWKKDLSCLPSSHDLTMASSHHPKEVGVATPAEPRGEQTKKSFFLCKFWAVQNF